MYNNLKKGRVLSNPDGDDLIVDYKNNSYDLRLSGVHAYETKISQAKKHCKNDRDIKAHIKKGFKGKKLLEKLIPKGTIILFKVLARDRGRLISNIYLKGKLFNKKYQKLLENESLSGGN